MQYEVYRHKDASDEDFDSINQIYKRVLSEDKWLCNETQQNLTSGTYVNGPLHPQYESGPLYLQGLIRDLLSEHRSKEEQQKMKIWPTVQDTQGMGETGADESFCASLDCVGSQREGAVSW